MGARMRRLVRVCAGVVSLAVAVTTLGAAPSTAAPVRPDPRVPTIPQRYLNQTLSWSVCDFDESIHLSVPAAPTTRCASIVAPMDWLHPDAHPDIRLRIAWSKATGSTRGLLTFNPGGPGFPGLNQAALLAVAKPQLFTSYDVLGFDPRGYGESTNVSCLSTEQKDAARQSVADPRVRNVKTHAYEVSEAKFLGDACSSTEFSQFVGTQQTVYDLEFLRRYLGRGQAAFDKLHYVGVSYGTWLGAWYADTYPSHTGRFILDSNMNWTSTMYANQLTDSFSFQRRRDAMFFPWVARNNKRYGFGKTAAAVKKNYESLRVRLGKAVQAGTAVRRPGPPRRHLGHLPVRGRPVPRGDRLPPLGRERHARTAP